MVERRRALEHLIHANRTRRVPAVQWLVEGCGVEEHPTKVLHLTDIPRGDGLIERRGVPETADHVGNRRGVPSADVLVEGRGVLQSNERE